jgi:flagellar protein FlaG
MSIQNVPATNSGASIPNAAAAKAVAAPVALPAVAPKKPAPVEQVRQIAAAMEKFVRESGRNLQFSVDEGSGQIVVKVVDETTGEVIRQIPNEEFLRIARSIQSGTADVSFICDQCV